MRFLAFLLSLILLLAAVGTAQGQSFAIPGIPGTPAQSTEEEASPEELAESLEVTIQALQDDESREALVQQLQALREGLQADASQREPITGGEGLLSALEMFFNDSVDQDSPNKTLLGTWYAGLHNAYIAAEQALAGTSLRTLVETAIGLMVWLAVLYALSRLISGIFVWRNWPLQLPKQPKLRVLTAHFIRRTLPWLLTFMALLAWAPLFDMTEEALTIILVFAYATLWARILTALFDTVISVFSSGHRQTAIAILRRQVPLPLFIIGALFALVDALETSQLTAQLGPDLAHALTVAFSIIAAVMSFYLILRNRRPVTHLIRNRPYGQRLHQSMWQEATTLLARLWYIPILLAISASVIAVFAGSEEADSTLGKAMLCALLLALNLAFQGLIGAQEVRSRQRALNRLSRDLVRFGYRLLQTVAWLVFFELILQIWALSLLGLGDKPPVSRALLGSLLGIILTVASARLAWISLDELLDRAMRGSDRKKKINTARLQTTLPMARKALLIIILVIAGLTGLSTLGVDITPLLAGAGIIGLAVGFGAQTLVQDLITGLFIVVEDSMSVGDFLEINGYMGTLEGFSLRTVRLRDLEGVLHHITFSKISSIHNMSRQFGIALIKIRVPRDLLIDDAIQLMKDTAEELRAQPEMRWLIWSPLEMQGIHSFEDGCPVLRMRMRTKPEYQWDVSRAFNLLLKRKMEEQFIDVAAPRISVQMDAEGGTRSPHVDGKNADGASASA